MEFDAEINAELNNLPDFTLEEIESSESDDNLDIPEDVPAIDYDPSHVDWMKLFLDRTNEQAKNIETNLSGAETVLKEIDKNVNECHSRALSALEERDFSFEDDSTFHDSIPSKKIRSEVKKISNDRAASNEDTLVHHQEFPVDIQVYLDAQKEENDKRILEYSSLCEKEILHRLDDIESKRLASEKHLQELEEAERRILRDLEQQKLFYENERRTNAACLIQSLFRRFLARKKYGVLVDGRLSELKERRANERLRQIEEKIRVRALESEQISADAVFQTEIDEILPETEQSFASESENDSDGKSSDETGNTSPSQSIAVDAARNRKSISENCNRVKVSSIKSNDIDSTSEDSMSQESSRIETESSVREPNTNLSGNELTSSRLKISPDDCTRIQTSSGTVESREKSDRSISPSQSFDKNEISSEIKVVENSLIEADALLTSIGRKEKSQSISTSQTSERITPAESDKTDQSIIEQEPVTPALNTADETNVKSVSIHLDHNSLLDVSETPEVAEKQDAVTTLQRDLALLEQSVVFDDDKNNIVKSDVATSKPKQNYAPKTAQNLMQLIDNDITQLNASVIFDSSKESAKNRVECDDVEATYLNINPNNPTNDRLISSQELIHSYSNSEIAAHDKQEVQIISSSQICASNHSAPSPELSCSVSNFELSCSVSNFESEKAHANSQSSSHAKSATYESHSSIAEASNRSQFSSPPEELQVTSSIESDVSDFAAGGSVSASSTQNFLDLPAVIKEANSKTSDLDQSGNKERFVENTQALLTSETGSKRPIADTNSLSESIAVNQSHSLEAVCSNASGSATPRKAVLNPSASAEFVHMENLGEKDNRYHEQILDDCKRSNMVMENPAVNANKEISVESNFNTEKSSFDGNQISNVSATKQSNNVQEQEKAINFCCDTKQNLSQDEDLTSEDMTENSSPAVSFTKASSIVKEVNALNNTFDCEKELQQQQTGVSNEKMSEDVPENHFNKPLKLALKKQASTQWKKWQQQCTSWEMGMVKNSSKSRLKRTIRKSSAARKLPPLSVEDILKGKWLYYKDLTNERTIESLSRVYIAGEDNNKGQNLINLQRCSNLTHLTLVRCGLVSLEGLQMCPSLRHIDVSHNNISVISCDGMKRLENLVAESNRLTSIHGLTGCHSLLVLDLSNNNITKIAGLEDARNLSHLRLANNQLMNVAGLSTVCSLLSLDVSSNTLSNLDGVEACGLLRFLNASNNCLSRIPVSNLTNLVLLVSLNLSGNSIENLDVDLSDDDSFLFLPFLAILNLERNKVSFEDGLGSCLISQYTPLLLELNLSQNLISNSKLLIDFLSPLSNLMRMLLLENLFSSEQEEEILSKCQEQGHEVFFQDEVIMTSPSKTVSAINQILSLPAFPSIKNFRLKEDDIYLNMTNKQRKEFFELSRSEIKEVKGLRGWRKAEDGSFKLPPDIFPYHCDYLQKHSELAIQQRLIQEGKHSYVEKSILSETNNSEHAEKETEISNNHKSFTNQKKEIVPDTNSENVSQSNEPALPNRAKSCGLYGQRQLKAALKIQSCWKNYAAQQKRRLRACVCIQAAWRGHVVRRNMKKAFASFNTSSSIDIDDFEEVDLSQLEFDENIYDQQWAIRTNIHPPRTPPPSTPIHRAYSAGIAQQPRTSPVKNSSLTADDLTAAKAYVEMDNSHNVWQKIASMSKPPLPPITPTGSTVTTEFYDMGSVGDGAGSDMDSHRSKYSRKEEVLANEWGLHNSSAVELMLKRAKRMKGRKKKQVNAEEKLRRFQDLKQRVSEKPLMTTRKPSQPPQKMEYFKARELEFESRERKAPSEDDERRRQYTYEWLHTSANMSSSNIHQSPHRGHHSTPRNPTTWRQGESSSVKSGFLPIIPQQRSVVSPLQQNDLEISSISSHNSQQVRSKNLLRDIARRHGGLSFHDQRR